MFLSTPDSIPVLIDKLGPVFKFKILQVVLLEIILITVLKISRTCTSMRIDIHEKKSLDRVEAL